MSETDIIDDILTHYGKKGMHWGVRSTQGRAPTAVAVKESRTVIRGHTKLKTKGGKNRPAHADAQNAQVVKQVLKKSGTHALSNQELRDYSQRINLEQSAKKVTISSSHPVKKWLRNMLKSEGQKVANQVVEDQRANAVAAMMGNKDKK